MIKIAGMLHDCKERFVIKIQKKPQTKTKNQRKHPAHNKLTKVSFWKKIYSTLGI